MNITIENLEQADLGLLEAMLRKAKQMHYGPKPGTPSYRLVVFPHAKRNVVVYHLEVTYQPGNQVVTHEETSWTLTQQERKTA